MLIVIIIVFAVTAVSLGAWSVSATLDDRRGSQRSLRAVIAYGSTTTVREDQLVAGMSDRVVTPLIERLERVARRFTPVGYADGVRTKIVLAGNPAGVEVDKFLAAKVLGLGSIVFWFILFGTVLPLSGVTFLLVVGLLSAGSFFAPDLVLRRNIDARREEIERALPDMLDLLVISVQAGLGFEQALDRTANAVPGSLSEEFRRMLQEIRMGSSRADALRALDERTQVDELRTFILAMLQADNFGISIAQILHTHADEMRVRRRLKAQERAMKMPVKMLFPLVFCIFPAIFVVILLPGMLTITDALA